MIKCRFAPSPTGFLHIGNVRTALFNYLFARHNGGEFHLRIEDTDKERSTKQAIDVIFDGLNTFGLEYDGEVVYQSNNSERHKEVAVALLNSGKAYKCFHTSDELDEIRKKNKGKVTSKWRNVDSSLHPNLPYVIRIKSPTDGCNTIHDMIQRDVTINNKELDDMIILRSDGSPVYQLAVVVDDHDAGITHVIRGDDHLTNTFRQNMIYDAMNWDKPVYGHLPLIMDSNGHKVSKRTGAASIVDFFDMGYLPITMMNYLVKLGWSDEQEFFTKEELINKFDIDKVGSSPSRLDMKKLNFINGHYISETDDDTLVSLFYKEYICNTPKDVIKTLMPSLKVRSKTIDEIRSMVEYLDFDWWVTNREDVPSKIDNLKTIISKKVFDDILEFSNNEELMNKLKKLSEDNDIKLKDVAAFVRYTICGKAISPPLDVVIKSLDKENIKERYDILYG